MTHAEKIANYRAALTGLTDNANEIMDKCKKDGNKDEWGTWFGIRHGLDKALVLTKILD